RSRRHPGDRSGISAGSLAIEPATKACTVTSMPASIIPSLRYRNAPAAIEWLCRVFGVQKNLVVPDESGGIAHAQLSCGDGMMMLGAVRDEEWRRFIKPPDEIGGAATQSIYLVVSDAEIDYERAKNAGAEILIPVKDEGYGGPSFSCSDLDGDVWPIGTYDPW